jgi:hypothetical protein
LWKKFQLHLGNAAVAYYLPAGVCVGIGPNHPLI